MDGYLLLGGGVGAANMVRLVDPLTGAVSDTEISDRDLAPGDWFVVNQGQLLPCDAMLLSGRVSVDESCLTGESVPVNKVPVDEETFLQKKPEVRNFDKCRDDLGNIWMRGTTPLQCFCALCILESTDSMAWHGVVSSIWPVDTHVSTCIIII